MTPAQSRALDALLRAVPDVAGLEPGTPEAAAVSALLALVRRVAAREVDPGTARRAGDAVGSLFDEVAR